jgi:hypothetical protein
MRQVLHPLEHLLNTPSASITDEPDLKSVRNRLPAGVKSRTKPRKSTCQDLLILIDALSHLDCRATRQAANAREAGIRSVHRAGTMQLRGMEESNSG